MTAPSPIAPDLDPAQSTEVDDAELSQQPYGEFNKELPEELVNILRAIIEKFQHQDMYDRRREVLTDRRNRFYERGYQHLVENSTTGQFTMQQAGGWVKQGNVDIQCPSCIDDYNIVQPCQMILEAIMTQASAGVNFRPCDPSSAEDMDAAKAAEGYREHFDRQNDVNELRRQMVRMMALSGRTVIWTKTAEDGPKYGYDAMDQPVKMQMAQVFGTLETKCPITAKCLSDCHYFFISDDPDVLMAKQEYPDFAKEIKASQCCLGESEYERIARLGVLQGTRQRGQAGESTSHLTTRLHAWIRPAAFNMEICDEAFEGGTIKDALNQLFPKGALVTFVGETYVGSAAEAMEDSLVVFHPYPGDGMFRLAMMQPGIVIQDRFNDDMNAYAEVKDYGWPSTWVHGEQEDVDAIVSQKASPYSYHGTKARTGQQLEHNFFREPDPNIPASFFTSTQDLLQLLYFILATPPALFGQAESDQKTAAGFAQMRAQAMGRLGLPYGVMNAATAQMYYQAALKAAQDSPDEGKPITVSGADGRNTQVDISALNRGAFRAYPDMDAGFPESTEAKRTTLNAIFQLAGQSPVGMQIIDNPDNLETYKEVNGFPRLVIPEAEARNKQVGEIEKLLQQTPIPPDPMQVQQAEKAAQVQHAAQSVQAEQMGMPAPPMQPFDPSSLIMPSIMPLPMDLHPWEFKKCQDWMSSEEGCREKDNNPTGFQNVVLHAQKHWEMRGMYVDPPPMPVMPHPAGPPAAGPKKPPISAPPGSPHAATM